MAVMRASAWAVFGWVCLAACSYNEGTLGPPSDGSTPDDAPVGGDAAGDDAPEDPDARTAIDSATTCDEVCAASGGTCVADVCEIICIGNDACGSVTCPAGVACNVICTGGGSGTGCNSVTCAPGQPCTVACTGGPGVALGGGTGCSSVNCNGACSCDVTCVNGTGVLGGGTGCGSTTCLPGCDQGAGCTTTGGSCNTCP
jgi:hypothetical protein